MRFKTYFDRVFIVNLPERLDRRRAVTWELNAAGLPLRPGHVEFFPAIRPTDRAGFPSLGSRGCFLSHLAIFKRARDEGLRNVLILEDDLEIAGRFRLVEQDLVTLLQQVRWDLCYIGHVEVLREEEYQRAISVGGARVVPVDRPILQTHFYAVNGTILPRLIDAWEQMLQRPPGHPDGGPMHADGALSVFRKHNPDVVTLLCDPSLGAQRSSRSDLCPRWFDRVPVIRTLVGSARSTRTWITQFHRGRRIEREVFIDDAPVGAANRRGDPVT